ncbi:MAG: linked oxidase domain protein [Gammaproteobacteria bacterium]|jgi:Fe-S oxidoreductase|nr:linked oxidase domain protein [Gammaproteobacteria bacterium]
MAGTYGHEVRHQLTSQRIYDLSWRQHLQQSAGYTVLASGYSCRSQVKRFDHQSLLHPAQALLAVLSTESRVLRSCERQTE